MPRKPIRQKRTISNHENKWIVLFNDDEVDLEARFEWQGNSLLKVELKLYNLQDSPKYQICSVARCENVYPHPYNDYMIIHVSTNTEVDESTFTYDFQKLVPMYRKTDSLLFLFKESILSCEVYNPNCEFQGGTPDSKDGSILIGTD